MPVRLNISDYSDADMLFSYWMKRKIDLFTGDIWGGEGSEKPNPLHLAIDRELHKLRPLRTPNLPMFIFDSNFNFYRFKKSDAPRIEKAPEVIQEDTPNEDFLVERKN